jgi:hypothetical protein
LPKFNSRQGRSRAFGNAVPQQRIDAREAMEAERERTIATIDDARRIMRDELAAL